MTICPICESDIVAFVLIAHVAKCLYDYCTQNNMPPICTCPLCKVTQTHPTNCIYMIHSTQIATALNTHTNNCNNINHNLYTDNSNNNNLLLPLPPPNPSINPVSVAKKLLPNANHFSGTRCFYCNSNKDNKLPSYIYIGN